MYKIYDIDLDIEIKYRLIDQRKFSYTTTTARELFHDLNIKRTTLTFVVKHRQSQIGRELRAHDFSSAACLGAG